MVLLLNQKQNNKHILRVCNVARWVHLCHYRVTSASSFFFRQGKSAKSRDANLSHSCLNTRELGQTYSATVNAPQPGAQMRNRISLQSHRELRVAPVERRRPRCHVGPVLAAAEELTQIADVPALSGRHGNTRTRTTGVQSAGQAGSCGWELEADVVAHFDIESSNFLLSI